MPDYIVSFLLKKLIEQKPHFLMIKPRKGLLVIHFNKGPVGNREIKINNSNQIQNALESIKFYYGKT